MKSMENEQKSHDFLIAFGSAVLALLAYAIGLGASDLMGDPLKYALNIPYPHPPFIRGLMWMSEQAFGFTPFWARFPIACIAAASVGVLWILFRRIARLSRPLAGILTAGFALAAPWVMIVRQGYPSPSLALAWLLVIIGIVLCERGRRREGIAVVIVTTIIGLWSQLQMVWIGPVLLVAAWQFRSQWKEMGAWERTLIILLPLHGIAWLGYVLTQPLIIGDLLSFVNDRKEQVFLAPDLWFIGASVLLAGLWIVRGMRWKPFRFETWEWCALTLSLTVLPLVFYNPVAWYAPYVWACAALAAAAVFRTVRTLQYALTAAIILSVLMAFGVWDAWDVDRPYRDAMRDAIALTSGASEILILGSHGYEWEYGQSAVARDFPTDPAVRARATHAIASSEVSLSAEEKAWLTHQERIGVAGPYTVYFITNPAGTP